MERGNAYLGCYIRRSREALGWSLRDLGTRAGISHTQVDIIEKGYDPRTGKDANTTTDTLFKLAHALSVPVSHLLACLEERVSVRLSRPQEDWYPDEVEDWERARDGEKEMLRLRYGHGTVEVTADAPAPITEREVQAFLFGADHPVSAATWDKVKTFIAFLKQTEPLPRP